MFKLLAAVAVAALVALVLYKDFYLTVEDIYAIVVAFAGALVVQKVAERRVALSSVRAPAGAPGR